MSESCSAVCKSTCMCACTCDDLDVDTGMNHAEMENNMHEWESCPALCCLERECLMFSGVDEELSKSYSFPIHLLLMIRKLQ